LCGAFFGRERLRLIRGSKKGSYLKALLFGRDSFFWFGQVVVEIRRSFGRAAASAEGLTREIRPRRRQL